MPLHISSDDTLVLSCPQCGHSFAHLEQPLRVEFCRGYDTMDGHLPTNYRLRDDGIRIAAYCECEPEHQFWVVVGSHKGSLVVERQVQ